MFIVNKEFGIKEDTRKKRKELNSVSFCYEEHYSRKYKKETFPINNVNNNLVNIN